MWNQKGISVGIIITVFAFFGFCATTAVSQEESPIEIKAYVLVMSMDAMNETLKDGINRDELTDMQTRQFAETGVLPKPEPVDLKVGELNVEIPSGRINPFLNDLEQKVVVFFFEIVRSDNLLNDEGTIVRRSYAISTDSNNEMREIQEKKGKWRLPAKIQNYRLFDFRHASFLKNSKLVYELNLDFAGDVKNSETSFEFSAII